MPGWRRINNHQFFSCTDQYETCKCLKNRYLVITRRFQLLFKERVFPPRAYFARLLTCAGGTAGFPASQFAWRAISLRSLSRSSEALQETVSKVQAEGAEPLALALDLREPASAELVQKQTFDR